MGWGITTEGIGQTIGLLETLQFQAGEDATYIVGPTVSYAIYHELGTSNMEARPFARPAAERVQANLDSKVGQFLDGGLLESDEEAVVEAAALAVEAEMIRIITRKGIIDTGQLRNSVRIAKV